MMTGWRKALTWAGAVAYAYVGSRIILPGVDTEKLSAFTAGSRGGLLGLYELVFQGGLHRAAILGLGIMPYLSARIFMRLFRVVNPDAKPSKSRVRALTAVLSVIQGIGFATALQRIPGAVANPGAGFMATTVLTMTAASLIAMWFGEKLTTRDADEPELSALPERPSVAPALPAPGIPASPRRHPHPSSDAETLRTPR